MPNLKIQDPNDKNVFYLFGSIYSWTAEELKDKLSEADPSQPLYIFINSPGGDVFSAINFRNLLEVYPADIHIIVAGLAASAATLITTCSNARVYMAKGSMFMIHNPSSMAYGDSDDMRKQADVIDQVKNQIIKLYQSKTKLSSAKLSQMMTDETWLDDGQALKYGFVDEIDQDDTVQTQVSNHTVNVIKNDVSFSFNLLTAQRNQYESMDFGRVKNFLGSSINRYFQQNVSVKNMSTTNFPQANQPMKTDKDPINIKNTCENTSEVHQDVISDITNVVQVDFDDHAQVAPLLKSFQELEKDLEKNYPVLSQELKQHYLEEGYKNGVKAERDRLQSLDDYQGVVNAGALHKIKYEDFGNIRDLAMFMLNKSKADKLHDLNKENKIKEEYLQSGERAFNTLKNAGSGSFVDLKECKTDDDFCDDEFMSVINNYRNNL